MKIVAMIPARLGSNRLKKKNLLKINDETLVSLCLNKCIRTQCFDKVVLNTESSEIATQAPEGVEVYYRSKDIANSTATSEDFVRDYLVKNECDYLFQIHTIAPLLMEEEIISFVHKFIDSGKQVGLCYEKIILETVDHKEDPINFTFNKKQNSQELSSLKKINWCMTGWKTENLLNERCLSFGSDRYFHEVSKLSGFVIKTMEEYLICKRLMEKKC